MRIVSLLPSATEIICGLGLRRQLVGVTHECDYPMGVSHLPKVTETLIPVEATSREIDALVRERLTSERALYSLNMPVLSKLQPDVIVTQTLCNVCAVAESEVNAAICTLESRPQVVNLEPECFADVFDCIRQVAAAVNCVEQSERFVAALQRRVELVASRCAHVERKPRTMLLEWIDPPFSAGHWNPELIAIAGGEEVIGVARGRSEQVAWEQVVSADPEVLVISCCGFSIARTMQDLEHLKKRPSWSKLSCVRTGRVYVVDGAAYFSRPGPRLVDSLEIVASILHPQLFCKEAALRESGYCCVEAA